MGIPSEPTKYRRKKIFQLLFFYEAAGYGKKFFEADESFDHFLGLLSLTKNDLKPLKKIEDIYGCLYHFRPVNGIKIRRLDENGLPVIYSVTLPGFTLEEILQYHKKSIQEQRSVLAARVERTSVEECEALVYSQQSLGIFSYIQFSEGEIQSAFKELQKAGLIKPISLINGVDPRSAQSINDKRYIIADKRLQNLIDVIWGLYRQKLSLLITKHHINELDKRDREWLIYMFGKEAANKILRGLDVNKRSASDSNIAKMEYQKEQIDFDEQMYFIFKKYKPVLQEYDFQLDLIYKLLYL